MAGRFEKIVRPFETGQSVLPIHEIPPGMSWDNSPIRLHPGRTGRTKTFQGSYNYSISYYVTKRPKEKA